MTHNDIVRKVEVLCMDCMDGFKNLPNESVDCVITDPPYRIKAGGVRNEDGQLKSTSKIGNRWISNKGFSCVCKDGDMFANDIDFSDWVPEVYRILKSQSHFYAMCNSLNSDKLRAEAEKVGFRFIDRIIWVKNNKIATPNVMHQHEEILMFRKGEYRVPNLRQLSNVIVLDNVSNKGKYGLHPSEKPVELMKKLVLNSTNKGELILDPFSGRGSTAMAALETGRNFIGFEIEEKWATAATERIAKRKAELFSNSTSMDAVISLPCLETHITTSGYDNKPTNVGVVTNQLKNNAISVSSKQLAEYICYGYSICPSHPTKAIAENAQIHYIGFDFDSTNNDYPKRLETLMDTPTIAYHTFSHTEQTPKYRFIYVFSSPIKGDLFYTIQQKLMCRNSFDDVDIQTLNINRLFHGTNKPVFYSGIVYDLNLNPFQEDAALTLTRDHTTPPPLVVNENHRSLPISQTYANEDIEELISVGVSSETAQYYYTYSWNDFTSSFTTTTTIHEQTEYKQLDGECYAVAPDDFYTLPRMLKYLKEEYNGNTHTVVKPRKWKDGQNRGLKLYHAIITYRLLNPTATPDDLLLCTIREYLTFYSNYNSDGKTKKYDHRGLAHQFVCGMQADITKPRKSLNHPSIHITSDKVNKHIEAPRASAKERHKKILQMYSPDKDIEANLEQIRAELNITISKRTLMKKLREKNLIGAAQSPTKQDRLLAFEALYNPQLSDAENIKILQDNMPFSRSTYYRMKSILRPSVESH